MRNDNVLKNSSPSVFLVLLAFATIYLVWGSTYLVIFFAIETIPPFIMAGIRYLFAGVLLYAVLSMKKIYIPTIAQWKSAAIVGCLMLVGGNGMVSWSEQYVPSGLAALMVATVPLWMVMLDWLLYKGPRPGAKILVGLGAGLIGLFILIGPSNIAGERINPLGAAALMFACMSWAFGSLRSRHANLPPSPFLATAMQMTAGGLALLLLGLITGEWSRVDWANISGQSILSVAYLSIFGSIAALTAYTWLLRVTSSAKVATYAYVNPVVAMFLGWMFVGEAITPRVIFAATIILLAVILITTARKKQKLSSVQDDSSCDPDSNELVEPVVGVVQTSSVAVDSPSQQGISQVEVATCCQNK